MSLSTFVSFHSRFVTYLLNFPRTYCIEGLGLKWYNKGPMGLSLEAVDDNGDDGDEVLNGERT